MSRSSRRKRKNKAVLIEDVLIVTTTRKSGPDGSTLLTLHCPFCTQELVFDNLNQSLAAGIFVMKDFKLYHAECLAAARLEKKTEKRFEKENLY